VSTAGHAYARLYHSSDHPDPQRQSFNAAEQDILSAAYRYIPTHGFAESTLAVGAREAGYLDTSSIILSNGVFDLIRWHLVTQRQRLAEKKEEILGPQSASLNMTEKLERLVWARLMGNAEIIRRWQEVGSNSSIFP